MDKEQKEKQIKKLAEVLKESFSEEELKEMQGFLDRMVELLVEAYLDGDLFE